MSRLMPYPGPGPARSARRPAQMAGAAVLAALLSGCAEDGSTSLLHNQAPNVKEIQHTQYPNFAPDKTERPPVPSPEDRKKLESELETLAKSRAGQP